jgi:hypothetical protein
MSIPPEVRRAPEPRQGRIFGQWAEPTETEKRIVYQNGDGIAIIIPADGVSVEQAMRDVPEGASSVIVDAGDIPSDRTFRAAWKASVTDQKPGVAVDMPKARNVWRDAVRRRRKPLLEALDVEYQKADETGNSSEKAKIANKKKKLRDATDDPRIEAAQTPEDLKQIDPLA